MIQILSNITPGCGFFARELARLSGEKVCLPEGYNTWIQTLASPSRELLQSRAIFLILDGRELVGRNINLSAWKESLEFPLDIIRQFRCNHPNAPLFISSIDLPQRSISTMSEPRLEHRIMDWWREGLANAEIPVLELAEIVANMGRDNFYNSTMWYSGSIPFSRGAEIALAHECHRAFKALSGQRRKCMVLDLDNTLWGGAIGEEGLEGIVLDSSKQGSCYKDFQGRIKELKEQGILLTIVSKNHEEDALAPLRKHPEMQLHENDFVAIKANWLPKSENIARIAEELNLGLDSFVFIDDNPLEREEVKIAHPQVAVPDFPASPADLESFIRAIANEYFPLIKVTTEDMNKAEQYQTEQLREREKSKFTSLEAYLSFLNMRLSIKEADAESLPRIAQLTQKTNQFNLTTRRYTEANIAQISASPNWRIWIGELEDRFGTYGKIILCIAKIEDKIAILDTYLMSCRVMGRSVEYAFLEFVENKLREMGITEIIAEFVPTAKNSMTSRFWDESGYSRLEQTPEHTLYSKDSSSAAARKNEFITVIES